MKAILKRSWQMIDFSKRCEEAGRDVTIEPGTIELERVQHPLFPKTKCLVIKGTMVGMAENAFRQWRDDDNQTGVQRNDEIWIIEE